MDFHLHDSKIFHLQDFIIFQTTHAQRHNVEIIRVSEPTKSGRQSPVNFQDWEEEMGGPRPSGKKAVVGRKTEISMRGAASIPVTGTTAGAAQTTVSTFPWAIATMAQSLSLSGMVPPCSHACRGAQTVATAMNSQIASDTTPDATKRRWRKRRLMGHFLCCKPFAR